jgi:hypothetical protein
LSDWDVNNIKDTSYCFGQCSNLNTLILNNWNLSNLEIPTQMFSVCSKLSTSSLQNIGNVLLTINLNKIMNWNIQNLGLTSSQARSSKFGTDLTAALEAQGWRGIIHDS